MYQAGVPAAPVLERTATTEPLMNTYDPSDHIRYVHLSGQAAARSAPAAGAIACATLPAGYANQSPRTRLQRRQGPVRGNRARVASRTA